MSDEAMSDFSLPWCQALFKNPSWRAIITVPRVRFQNETENGLLAGTLRTDRTIRAIQSFEKLKASSDGEDQCEEVCMLFSLGSGVDGMTGICHGGVVGVLLDEVLGLMVAVVSGSFQCFTAELNITFKAPLGTPRVVLCRAWLDPEKPAQGRKFWVKGTVEDGEGGLFAQGSALFVMRRETL